MNIDVRIKKAVELSATREEKTNTSTEFVGK